MDAPPQQRQTAANDSSSVSLEHERQLRSAKSQICSRLHSVTLDEALEAKQESRRHVQAQ